MDPAEWTQPCQTCRKTGWIPDEPDGWNIPDMSMSGCPNCTRPGETGGRGWKWKPDTIETALKAGRQAYNDAPVPIRQEDFVRRIVVAVLDTLGDTE